MKEKKLVITGMGAVTPIGIGVSAYWEALKVSGHCGIGRITRFDASDLPVQIAAELKGFDPADHMPKALARTMDPFMQFAFAGRAGGARRTAGLRFRAGSRSASAS